ncbi:MAG: flagellar hook-length control protein FliK [Candidatus Hydrogenedentes bacterium]|nr:flagellar hook-length control protein FliK [Candidatus Hydrogenedentota bacterium]
MLTGGHLPAPVFVTPAPPHAALYTGQTHSALIRLLDGALVAHTGPLSIPIPPDSGLREGQRVILTVRAAANGVQIEIRPVAPHAAPTATATSAQATAATSPGAAPAATTLSGAIQPVLEALGRTDLAPRIPAVLPPALPATAQAIEPVVRALLADRGAAQALGQFQQVLAALQPEGVLPPDLAASVTRWLGLDSDRPAAWRALLDQARAEHHAAARIARAIASPAARAELAALRDSAASLAQRLLDDPAFRALATERGQLQNFQEAANRLAEHTRGADLQNLRSLDQPYQFLSLPVRESGGFFRADLHLFGEGGAQGRGRRGQPAQAILDLDTTRLGPLWVALRAAGTHCACHIRAADPGVAAHLAESAPALREALATAGYPDADVTVEAGDGDRIEALIHLLAPYQKLDLEG